MLLPASGYFKLFVFQLPGPTCLLYVKDSKDLVPVAIQLMPKPGSDNPVCIQLISCSLAFNVYDNHATRKIVKIFSANFYRNAYCAVPI